MAIWFWDVLEEMTSDERAGVLRFTTGCPRVPLDGFDPEFTLVCNQEMSPDALPRAHTCFNKLVLPPYTLRTKDAGKDMGRAHLRKQLLTASQFALGFGLT